MLDITLFLEFRIAKLRLRTNFWESRFLRWTKILKLLEKKECLIVQ
jgi:hypothetical protein